MSAFSLLLDSLNTIATLTAPPETARKSCRMNFGTTPRLDVERESQHVICSEYVAAKAAYANEPTEATAKAFRNARAALLSRLRSARRNRIDANGCRFTLHEDGGIGIHSRLRKYRNVVPCLIRAF